MLVVLCRFCQMMWRLNFLVLFCCIVLRNDYMLYYICPMHTLFTVCPEWRDSYTAEGIVLLSIAHCALCRQVLTDAVHHCGGVKRFLPWPCRLVFTPLWG